LPHTLTNVTRLVAALILVAASATTVLAQGELATITGTIRDTQGGVMPGVTATAINLDTNVKTTVVSNEAGVYVLPSLVTDVIASPARSTGSRPWRASSS
jgi:hypothetical protein